MASGERLLGLSSPEQKQVGKLCHWWYRGGRGSEERRKEKGAGSKPTDARRHGHMVSVHLARLTSAHIPVCARAPSVLAKTTYHCDYYTALLLLYDCPGTVFVHCAICTAAFWVKGKSTGTSNTLVSGSYATESVRSRSFSVAFFGSSALSRTIFDTLTPGLYP